MSNWRNYFALIIMMFGSALGKFCEVQHQRHRPTAVSYQEKRREERRREEKRREVTWAG
jgi:hypothetical protein